MTIHMRVSISSIFFLRFLTGNEVNHYATEDVSLIACLPNPVQAGSSYSNAASFITQHTNVYEDSYEIRALNNHTNSSQIQY